MAFQANNVQVGDKKVASPSGGATPTVTRTQTTPTPSNASLSLNETEIKILLEALKNSTFKGEMVEIVYTLAIKLKNNL